MVETASGQLGFLDASRMSSVCRYLPAIKAKPISACKPKAWGAGVVESLTALDATKLQLQARYPKPGQEDMAAGGPDSSCRL